VRACPRSTEGLIAGTGACDVWCGLEVEGAVVMPFVREWPELRRFARAGQFLSQYPGAEMVLVSFRTDPKTVAAILPRPLRPAGEPLGAAFVAHYPQTNFGVTYHEGALFVAAQYRGERGWYCLSMPADNDTAVIGGREQLGWPKKMADRITLDRDGPHVAGSVVRHGAELLRVEGEFADPQPPGSHLLGVAAAGLDGRPCEKVVSFLFKYFPAADGGPFEHSPELIRHVALFRPRPGQLTGAAKIELSSTACDPLGEIPVHQVISAAYGVFDITALPGHAVRRIYNQWRFLPKSLFKNDAFALIDPGSLPVLTFSERRRQRKQLRAY
jgi:acetoacetate decarboxylase